MDKVYVIIREQGEYSDYSMEVIRAVANEQDAKDFVDRENVFERIKTDKRKEVSRYMEQFTKDNPRPESLPYNRNIPVKEFEKQAQENKKLFQEYYTRWKQAEEDFSQALAQQHYLEYKDKPSTECEDVRYSYQEMQIQ